MRPIHHGPDADHLPVIVIAGTDRADIRSSLSTRKIIRPISLAAKTCISAIARPAMVSEAGAMDRTRRLSRWHRQIFTAFRPF